jgi:nucleoside-diphosphate-sugar epimerase
MQDPSHSYLNIIPTHMGLLRTQMNLYREDHLPRRAHMSQTVLILGATGKIGRHSANAFQAAGWSVRRFNRSTDSLAEAAIGASVIVNGFNPAGYKNWATLVPAYTAEIIAAAKTSGATVIVPGNVYVYGDQPGTWDAKTPHRATTRKGKIRMAMEACYREAAKDGVRSIILRAGDFLDPNRDGTLMSLAVLRTLSKGTVTALGDPRSRHAYAYVPDWARAAVLLAEVRDQLAPFEDIPFPGTNFTIDELASAIAEETGREIRVTNFAWWMMYVASPVWKVAYEMLEMRYLSGLDHALSPERFNELLPSFEATSRSKVMLCEVPEQMRRNESTGATSAIHS